MTSIIFSLFLFSLSPLPAKAPEFIWSDALWELKRFPSYSAFFDELSLKGYSGIDLEIIDPNGNFYFYSPTLSKLNWTQQPDLLSKFIHELKSYNQKTKQTLSLSLNFSALAQRIQEKQKQFNPKTKKPAAKELEIFSLELQENYNFSDLTSEPYSFEFQNMLSATIFPPIKKLNLLATHPEFETFLSEAALAGKLSQALPSRLFLREQANYPLAPEESKFPSVGISEIAFALARTHQKKFYYGIREHSGLSPNFLLYRSFVHRPDGYLFFKKSDESPVPDIREIKKTIIELAELHSPEKKKPVANLVLSAQSPELNLSKFVEPIINALLANGYELKITFGEILKDVELYYITNSNEWLRNLSFFEELLTLLDHRKSRFYGKVILHPLSEILRTGRWKKIREHFKMPDTETGWVTDIPPSILERGRKILWKGTVPEKKVGMSFIREIQLRSQGGEALLSEVFHSQTFALILKSGNHFLVNGNALHLEAGYFLSQLAGGKLLSPVNAYVTFSTEGLAALALEETTLRVQLPYLKTDLKWRLLRYLQGQKVLDETIQPKELFEARLKAYELLVLVPLLQ